MEKMLFTTVISILAVIGIMFFIKKIASENETKTARRKYKTNTSGKTPWPREKRIAVILSVVMLLDMALGGTKLLTIEVVAVVIAWIAYIKKKKKSAEVTQNNYTGHPQSQAYLNQTQKPFSIIQPLSPPVRTRQSSSTSSSGSYMENNTIRIKDHSSFYTEFSKVSFGNGSVYCHYSSTGKAGLIGYYEVDNTRSTSDKTHVIVQAEHDKREIGSFELVRNDISCLIFLSNAGWYKAINSYDYSKKPYSLLAANMWIWNNNPYVTGVIEDNDTGTQMAEYKGDPIGAAAAFVCMYYEVSSSGKYHDFYHG